MADAVGNVLFRRLEGEIVYPRHRIVKLQRPNVKGVALRREAKQPDEFQLRGLTDYQTATAAMAAITQTLPNMVGNVVTVSMAGATYTDLTILDVQCGTPERLDSCIGALSGGSTCWAFPVTWTFIYGRQP